MPERALAALFPRVAQAQPFAELGQFPSPVVPLQQLAPGAPPETTRLAYVKRDDLSSPVYGGNKVRTLEALFGAAQACDCSKVYAVGAYGSNHAVATILHAPRVGLTPGALLFPQPHSRTARDNLRVSLELADEVLLLRHWLAVPFAMASLRRRLEQTGLQGMVMPPGGASPLGALGYVSGALEVAQQVQGGELPRPERVVVGIGSTCTTAGLLLGFTLAARMGIGFVDARGAPAPPQVVAVRVTPWPVTSRYRVLSLARRTGELLAQLGGDPRLASDRAQLAGNLEIDARFLGAGYGRVTSAGLAAIDALQPWSHAALDTTYTAKSAAGLLASLARHAVPTLYWATKSSAPLPRVNGEPLIRFPRAVTWLQAGERAARSGSSLA